MNINPLYILPNLFTAASIFVAILAIILAFDSRFVEASWYILFATLLDGLDGRVARLTNTASKFGVEFDSLADIVAFGVAPSIVLYFYVGHEYGRYGIAISGLFTILGAIRLARFNISADSDSFSFIGLPIPSAASIICLWIIAVEKYDLIFIKNNSFVFLFLGFLVAILMISNIRYPNFKKIKWNLKLFIFMIVIFALAITNPSMILTLLLTVYIFYGLFRWLFILFKFILFKKKKFK